jgi:hypothetical protein
LAHNVTVRKSNAESVLRRVVLVLVLGDQPLAGVVVGLTCACGRTCDARGKERVSRSNVK